MAVVVPFISTWDGKALLAAQKDMTRTAGVLKRQGAALSTVGSTMTKLVTVPILALAAAATYSAAQYGSAAKSMQKQTGATGERLEGMKRSFDAVYKEVPQKADAVASAIATISQRAEVTGSQLETLSRQSLNLARVTGGDVKTQIETTQRVMANWNVAAEEQGAAMDYLYATAQHTGLAYDRLAEGMITFGPSMRAFNMSFTEGANMLGQFEKAGVSVDTTAKSLTIALKVLAKNGFADPAAELPRLIEEIKNARTEGDAAGLAFKYFGKSGVYMLDAIRQGKVDLSSLKNELGDTRNRINSTADDTLGLGERWSEFGHKLESSLQPLGKTILVMQKDLIPMLEKGVGWINTTTAAFERLPEGGKKTVVVLGLLAASIGPVLTGLGSMARGASDMYKAGSVLVTWLGKMTAANEVAAVAEATTGAAAEAATPAVAGFGATVGAVALPFTLAAAAAGALYFGVGKLVTWLNNTAGYGAQVKGAREMTAAEKEAAQAVRDHSTALISLHQQLPQETDAALGAGKAVATYNSELGHGVKWLQRHAPASAAVTAANNGMAASQGAAAAATAGATDAAAAQTRALNGTMVALDSLAGKLRTSQDTQISYRESVIAQHAATKAVTEAMKGHGRSTDLVKKAQDALKDGTFLKFLDQNKRLTDEEKDAILRAASAYQDTKDKATDAKTAMDDAATAKTPPVKPVKNIASAWQTAFDNAVAYGNYIATHGSLPGWKSLIPPPKHDAGGYFSAPHIAWIAEKRPEYVINPARSNAPDLIRRAAADAGMTSAASKMIQIAVSVVVQGASANVREDARRGSHAGVKSALNQARMMGA